MGIAGFGVSTFQNESQFFNNVHSKSIVLLSTAYVLMVGFQLGVRIAWLRQAPFIPEHIVL